MATTKKPYHGVVAVANDGRRPLAGTGGSDGGMGAWPSRISQRLHARGIGQSNGWVHDERTCQSTSLSLSSAASATRFDQKSYVQKPKNKNIFS